MAMVLVRQHGRDVHTRRVVPDEERLIGLLRVVAIEEVDHLGRDLLVHSFGTLQASADPRPCMSGSSTCRRRTCTRSPDAAVSGSAVVAGSTAPGNLREAGDRRVLARRRDSLLGRRLVDVREAHALHRVQVIEVAPELLETVRRR